MAAPIHEHNRSFDGSGMSKAPGRDHPRHQDVLDNSLIKLKENDFSSFLLRQLPEPVKARQVTVRAADAAQTVDSSARTQTRQRPASETSAQRIGNQPDRQDRQPATPEQTGRSGDDLPLAEDNQRQQGANAGQDAENKPAAEDKAVVSEGFAAETDVVATEKPDGEGREVIAAIPTQQSPDEAAINTGSASTVAATASRPLPNPVPAVLAEGEAEQGDAEHLRFADSRTIAGSVSASGNATGGQAEAEVTREFKELGKSLAANPLAPAGSAPVVGTPQAERSELQRMAWLESGLKDKVAVTPPQTVVMRNAPTLSAPSSTYVTNIPAQVQTPEWQQGVVKKLLWFVSEKIQSAKIHVNPPELGPVDLKIQVSKDQAQAQVQIQSPHAVVRDLLEGTAIRLREMLANQGIDLTNFNVGSQGGQTQQEGGSQPQSQTADTGSDSTLEAETHVSVQSQGINQLVDYYV